MIRLTFLRTYMPKLAWFLHIQLFVSLISLPILAWWGLPISALTLVGNLIFSPLLSFFLFISSLLFFTELLHIPNAFIATILDYITTCWLWILSYAQRGWLISLPQPPLWWCILIPLGAVLIISTTRPILHSILFQVCLLISACAYLKLVYLPPFITCTVPCGRSELCVFKTHGTLVIIDSGASNTLLNPASWTEYTLLPALNKNVGSTHITHYIILKPTTRSCATACAIVEHTAVEKVYLPLWRETSPTPLRKAYVQLRAACKQEGSELVRLKRTTCSLACDTSMHITLKAQGADIQNNAITYPYLTAYICANNTTYSVSTKKTASNHLIDTKPANS